MAMLRVAPMRSGWSGRVGQQPRPLDDHDPHEQRAEHGPEDVAAPAHDERREDDHGLDDGPGVGAHRAQELDRQRAGDPGVETTDRHRGETQAHGALAERRRHVLVLARGTQGPTERRSLDAVRHAEQDGQHHGRDRDEHEHVVVGVDLELRLERLGHPDQSLLAVEEPDRVARHAPRDGPDRHEHHREVVGPDTPDGDEPDEQAHDAGRGRADQEIEREPEVEPEDPLHAWLVRGRQDRDAGEVGPDGHERDVREVEDPGHPERDVESEGQDAVDEEVDGQRGQVVVEIVRHAATLSRTATPGPEAAGAGRPRGRGTRHPACRPTR